MQNDLEVGFKVPGPTFFSGRDVFIRDHAPVAMATLPAAHDLAAPGAASVNDAKALAAAPWEALAALLVQPSYSTRRLKARQA
jgi:hypothetical protein